MANLENIAAYFEGSLSVENKKLFEQRIIDDEEFAEEVAFYISAKRAAASEMEIDRSRFRSIFEDYKQEDYPGEQRTGVVRKLWFRAAAAAVLVGIVLSIYFWPQPGSPEKLADKYINSNFTSLPVDMGGREDSLQSAFRLNNEGNVQEALKYLENLVLYDSASGETLKYAGIVSLRLEQYDKAIYYFSRLENLKLYANSGKFYHALSLLKRNRTGDKQQAKILLEQVVQYDLAEKETAQEWLKKW